MGLDIFGLDILGLDILGTPRYPWTRKLAKREKPRKKITDKTVRPSAKMKTSTNVNQGKKKTYVWLSV